MKALTRLCLTAALVAASAAPARADFFIIPAIGMATGGIVQDGTKVTYAGQIGVLTAGMVGFEGDFGYTAKTRGGNTHDNVRTFGGTVLIAPTKNERWRPYGAVGFGMAGGVGEISHIFTFDSEKAENAAAINGGGGIFGFLSPHLGVRFDARYFHVMLDDDGKVEGISPHFIRMTGGLVIRF
jgi:hypothetical protein